MLSINYVIEESSDEKKAALILSALGFMRSDWATLQKLGGASAVVKSDILGEKLRKCEATDRWFNAFLNEFQHYFSHFEENHGALVSPEDALFADAIPHAPLVVFSRFNHVLLKKRPSVAIVGSRKADKEALAITRALSAALAARGIVVVSGGAVGIDSEAHQAAVDAGGSTIIVSGVACSFKDNDLNYRWRTLKLHEQCVLYPYGPASPQGKFMFVGRNQYIAALADAVVVVCGSPGSGTLHTAQFAKKMRIPLFALPGDSRKELSYVPNMLIAKGEAQALHDFGHFADSLMTKSSKPLKSQNKIEKESKNMIIQAALPALLQLLKDKGKRATMDELMQWSELSCASIQQEMLNFEMDGLVFRQGSQFVLRLN